MCGGMGSLIVRGPGVIQPVVCRVCMQVVLPGISPGSEADGVRFTQ